MSGVPSAFILVLLVVLLMPEGVLTECVRVLVVVLMLPAGVWPVPVVEVEDFDTTAPGRGVILLLVVIRDELVCIEELCFVVVVAAPVAAGAAVWASTEVAPSRLSEARKPRIRFMKMGFRDEAALPTGKVCPK